MARGFNATLGAANTDGVLTALTSLNGLRSYAIWTYRRTGAAPTNVIWNYSVSTEFFISTSASVYDYYRAWSGNDGRWTIALPSADAWHHILITYNSGSTANNPTIYVDGVSVTVTETSSPSGVLSTVAGQYDIGRLAGNTLAWDGSLAEFAVWNRILDAAEAKSVYLSSPLAVPRDLVEYVPLLRENVSLKLDAPTITGTAVQPHPRVMYHYRPQSIAPTAAPAVTRRSMLPLLGVG